MSSDSTRTNYTVTYRDRLEQTLKFQEDFVEVRFPWAQMRNGETILYLGYPLIEQQRQQASSLTAHAACVELNGKAVLLLGKEGAGKTSVAFQLCRQYGAGLIANDLCVIGSGEGRLTALAGTKFFFLRFESVKRNLPELLSLFTAGQTKDPWLHKIKVQPGDLAIRVREDPIAIRSSYMLHIDETQEKLFVESADGLVTRLYLNENFSRYIRSTCTVMMGGSDHDLLGYIPSFDTEQFFEMRKELISMILGQANLRYVSGPLELVAEFVAENSQ